MQIHRVAIFLIFCDLPRQFIRICTDRGKQDVIPVFQCASKNSVFNMRRFLMHQFGVRARVLRNKAPVVVGIHHAAFMLL